MKNCILISLLAYVIIFLVHHPLIFWQETPQFPAFFSSTFKMKIKEQNQKW